MIQNNCPLCESIKIVQQTTINGSDLRKKYQKLVGDSYKYIISDYITQFKCHNCGLIFFNPMDVGDEAFYSSLQNFEWYYLNDKNEYHYITKYISKGDKILDVGCGKGAFLKLVPFCNYTGLELSKGAKNLAKNDGIHIKNETIQSHSCSHPEEYDLVCSFQVLEHVSDPFSFIDASLKTLRIGGLLIIAVPSEDSFLKYVVNGILNMPPHHVSRWSDKTLETIASIFNLEIIDIHHEKLEEIHFELYLRTLIENSILDPQLIDLTIKRKIVSIFSRLLAKRLKKGMKKDMLPAGHSVIAVYRKNENTYY